MSTTDKPPLREQVAEEIRALLGRRQISGSELARRLGMTQRAMSRRLTGETAFDMDDIEQVARVLGIEAADLLPRTEGRVVYAGKGAGQTTEPYSRPAFRPVQKDYSRVAAPSPASRRLVRISQVKS